MKKNLRIGLLVVLFLSAAAFAEESPVPALAPATAPAADPAAAAAPATTAPAATTPTDPNVAAQAPAAAATTTPDLSNAPAAEAAAAADAVVPSQPAQTASNETAPASDDWKPKREKGEAQPDKFFTTRSVTGKTAAAEGEVSEVLFTSEFVDFSGLDQPTNSPIQWDKTSGKFLYTSNNNKPPFVFLVGAIKAGYELSIDDVWIDVVDGRFEAKVHLPMEPRVLTLKVFSPERKLQAYRFTYFWLRPPPELRFKVKEGNKITQRGTAAQKQTKDAAFAQLYSGAHPTATIDLDAQKHSELTFRLYQLPDPDVVYDGWSMIIRNEFNETVGQVDRFGPPPEFIEWRDVASNVTTRGTYTYQLILNKGSEKHEGPTNQFDTVEGLSLLQHRYTPAVLFEPKEEIGWFSYSDKGGASYSNVYMGADLSLAFFNRFIIRGAGNVALHKVDPNSIYTYTRIGVGMRFGGQGSNSTLGDPYMYRLDILLNSSAYTLRPDAPIQRLAQASILVEPHLVFGGYHYIVPWFELGFRSESNQQRLTAGLSYYFYIRPWSMKLGVGAAWDQVLASDIEEIKFSIFRTMTNFIFYL